MKRFFGLGGTMTLGRKEPTPAPQSPHASGTTKRYMELLGHRVKDTVTGLEGVVTSITFDLYGCVQAIVHPGLDKDGKPRETLWFDVARLARISTHPVMDPPDFWGVTREQAITDGVKGAADRPPEMKT